MERSLTIDRVDEFIVTSIFNFNSEVYYQTSIYGFMET